MSALGSIILSVCVGASGSYQEACTNALSASARQTGFDSDFAMFQGNTERRLRNFAEDRLPEEARPAVGGFIFIAKTAVDRRVTVSLPTMGLADKVMSEMTPNSAILSFRWQF